MITISKPNKIVKHILELNIDERLKNKDTSLVNDIAKLNINGK